jgi:DNA-binding beta-propeller fold protein YncE
VVVVADQFNHRLALWRLGDGTVWKHLGSEGTEPGQFTYPKAVAVTGGGALVVTDEHRVQVLSVDGAVLCVLDPTSVVGVGRLGGSLFGVALYPGTDEILVTDFVSDRVVALSWSPEVSCYDQCCLHPACLSGVSPLIRVPVFVCHVQCGLWDARAFGSQGAQLGQFNRPRGVAVASNGDVWVADDGNYRLAVLR